MKIKRIILVILVLAWMGLIYAFSNMDTNKSNKKSIDTINKVSEKTIGVTNKTKITNIDSKNTSKELSKKLNLPFRKIAHFSVYFVLCILLILLLKECNINKYCLFSLIICFLFASSDEFHQMFVNGRNSSKLDVLIDTFGGICATCIYYFINRNLKKGDVKIEKI